MRGGNLTLDHIRLYFKAQHTGMNLYRSLLASKTNKATNNPQNWIYKKQPLFKDYLVFKL